MLHNCVERRKLYELNEDLEGTELHIMQLMRSNSIEKYRDAAVLIESRERIRCKLHDLHEIIYKQNEL
jgi:hypothetical protein